MLSIVIPSYKDPYMHKTVQSLLDNAEGEIEIIVVMDGYWTQVIDDPRVRAVHLGQNRGMRGAINAGVAVARGEYLMRTDEHSTFCKGYDRILTETCEDNWIVTPRRYFLDPVKWEIMDVPYVDYEKLIIIPYEDGRKFAGMPWRDRDRERCMSWFNIDETMAMQGSCWVMRKSWWDKVIGELQIEGYGPLYQDSHEMIFKTWKAGGKMMVNKLAWHAHKHRDFPRTHNNGTRENPSNNGKCFKYCLDTWEDYYNEIKKLWKI